MNSIHYRPRTYIRIGREAHAIEEYFGRKLNPSEPHDLGKMLGTDDCELSEEKEKLE